MTTDRDGYPLSDPWTTCPGCGVGKGADHVRGCPHGKRPPTVSADPEPRQAQEVSPDVKAFIRKRMSIAPTLSKMQRYRRSRGTTTKRPGKAKR